MKKRTESAFTLLEVLAAVAILGIWFAVLANVAIQGLRAEGENERRIRASLLADRYLTAIELGFDAGELPSETTEKFEEDEFTISVEARPFTDLELELELAEGSGPDEANTDRWGIFEGDLAPLAANLYSIRVTVRWIEGAAEKTVLRTTYFWDRNSLQEQLDDPDAQEADDEGGPASGSGSEGT